ncbi:MAG: hypothetical protein HQL26_09520, partial [Candidatus Omnitrophica bacterium]|nr:hypothetical protein [Candidatus Omnitrophota bacterium]
QGGADVGTASGFSTGNNFRVAGAIVARNSIEATLNGVGGAVDGQLFTLNQGPVTAYKVSQMMSPERTQTALGVLTVGLNVTRQAMIYQRVFSGELSVAQGQAAIRIQTAGDAIRVGGTGLLTTFGAAVGGWPGGLVFGLGGGAVVNIIANHYEKRAFQAIGVGGDY